MLNKNLGLVMVICLLASSAIFSYEDQSIKKEVEAQGFIVGNDSDLGGTFYYIVDKTSGICLAAVFGTPGNGGNGGLAEVSCDKLRKIPKINSFLGPIKEEKKETPVVVPTVVPVVPTIEATISQNASPSLDSSLDTTSEDGDMDF
ncbi:MAG: hypothetical protein A2381_02730 [Bdellovibrionales bacterium RIFOXYB1_FULL_37_110]|nr:MAG: hypothetical protein A2181_05110 [Bdellovibrionales bacterium RIFOXYA1_FULL_38_20]OFZ52613.1 MAG: hypothetical protein A2417_01065 [Bdellovibrionales bacterium RIFOXYC1_FULL_37_79]OFZ53679.1 MAG: hypothetical protein A2328_04655 [Bdellovibrionales bacterium RIFOXYB2_FULL_36_6]OFZ58303.1 MAG: hypothetical protein A2381_02730 [Bdellovibrionales bacterium RIFOXYB1_FULL_37_110]OFZ65278.1 MAG: hypothetical protein A2577_03985 [Bdellovibrionales bacterium RIFOXYD1_FULL_36_51]